MFLKEEILFHIISKAISGSGLRLSYPYNSFINSHSVGDNVDRLHIYISLSDLIENTLMFLKLEIMFYSALVH